MTGHLVASVVAVVVLAACGAGDDAGTSDLPADADPVLDDGSLDGDWVVDQLTLDGERVVLDPTYAITMRIDDAEIGGTAACNQYGGRLETTSIGGGGDFRVGELSWTEMGCEAIPMELEQAFLTVLQRVDSYEVADGVFVAQAGVGNNFHLSPVEPAEPASLTGTDWVLDTSIDGAVASTWPGLELVHLRFGDDGTLAGATACTAIDGNYVLDGERLSIERLDRVDIPDLSDCDDGDAETNSLVFDVLSGLDATLTIDGSRLTIEAKTSDGDRMGLSFRATPDQPGVEHDDSVPADLDPAGGVDGPVMYGARTEPDADQMAAEILGTLERDGDCLYTVFEGIRYPVLWPFGTTWDADADAVVLPDGSTIALGDEVRGGGGYLSRGMSAVVDVTNRLDECAEEPYFEVAVLQSW